MDQPLTKGSKGDIRIKQYSGMSRSTIAKAHKAGANWESRARIQHLVPRSCYTGDAPTYTSKHGTFYLKPGFGAGQQRFTMPQDTFAKGFYAISKEIESHKSTCLVFLINTSNTKYNAIDECNIAGMHSQAFAVSMPTPGERETNTTYYSTSETIIRQAWSETNLNGKSEWDMAANNIHIFMRKPGAPTEDGEIPVVYLGRHAMIQITGKKVHLKRHRWIIEEENDSNAGTIANPTEYHTWKRFRTRKNAALNPGSSVQMLNLLATEAARLQHM